MQRTIEIVAAGHVCLDVIPEFHTGDLPQPGGLAEVGPMTICTGGSVSNTGIALHRLGLGVRLVGRVGDDPFGREVRRLYDAAGDGLSGGLETADDAPTSYTVVISPVEQDRRFLHCPGANSTFRAAHVPDTAFADAKLLHFGYPPLMKEMCHREGAELRALFDRSRAAGLATSLDMCGIDPASWAGSVDWPAVFANVLPAVNFFLPSLDEILVALGRSESSVSATPDLVGVVAEHFLNLGPAVVAFKMGDRGLYLRSTADAARLRAAGLNENLWAGREIWAPTFICDVAGTTGAGDTTIAGFLAAVVRGEDPLRALDIACATGAACVTCPDAISGVCTLDEINDYIAGEPDRRRLPELQGWATTSTGLYRSARDGASGPSGRSA